MYLHPFFFLTRSLLLTSCFLYLLGFCFSCILASFFLPTFLSFSSLFSHFLALIFFFFYSLVNSRLSSFTIIHFHLSHLPNVPSLHLFLSLAKFFVSDPIYRFLLPLPSFLHACFSIPCILSYLYLSSLHLCVSVTTILVSQIPFLTFYFLFSLHLSELSHVFLIVSLSPP